MFSVRLYNVGYFTVFCMKRVLFVKAFSFSIYYFCPVLYPFITTGKKERLAERGGVWSFGEACSDWFAAVTDSDQ